MLTIAVASVLAFIPFAHLTSIVASTGADNISNDDLVEVGMIDQMLSGTYHWANYFHDTFIRSHCFAFAFLIRLGVIVITHWNLYLELYIGIAATVLKLLLLFAAFTYFDRRLSSLALLPILSALCFSLSQINVFTFADASLQIQFNQLGLAIGVFSLVRFRYHWYGIALAALGGLIACWSGGGGLPVWPAFLLGMALLGWRQKRHYAMLAVSGFVVFLPYVFYELLAPHNAGSDRVTTILNLDLVRQAIGMPFSQSFAAIDAQTAGTVGLLLCGLGLALLPLLRGNSTFTRAAPALMVLLYGALNIWLATSVRATLAPWYTSHFMLFWVGLVGLAYVIWTDRPDACLARTLLTRIRSWHLPRAWSLLFLVALAQLYYGTNMTYADKASYLYSRAPVSAACLRNFAVAPSYCEGYLFQWGVGHPAFIAALGGPLQRHHLQVFAPDEQWTLQGDYVFDSVRTVQLAGPYGVAWTPDRGQTLLPFSDYRHLDLMLPARDAVSWSVSLPRGLRDATFHSAVALGGTPAPSSHGLDFRVDIRSGQGRTVAGFRHPLRTGDSGWHPFALPLTAYAGKTIVLTLRVMGSAGGSQRGLYQYPTIDVSLDPVAPTPPEAPVFAPATTISDARFKTSEIEGMSRTLHLCLADYTDMSVRVAAAPPVQDRVVDVSFGVTSPTKAPRNVSALIPLWADGAVHRYTYDLKLLEQPPNSRIIAVSLSPPSNPGDASLISVKDFRLIHRAGPSRCDR